MAGVIRVRGVSYLAIVRATIDGDGMTRLNHIGRRWRPMVSRMAIVRTLHRHGMRCVVGLRRARVVLRVVAFTVWHGDLLSSWLDHRRVCGRHDGESVSGLKCAVECALPQPQVRANPARRSARAALFYVDNGRRTETWVPRPVSLETSKPAPIKSARSRIPMRPKCPLGARSVG